MTDAEAQQLRNDLALKGRCTNCGRLLGLNYGGCYCLSTAYEIRQAAGSKTEASGQRKIEKQP